MNEALTLAGVLAQTLGMTVILELSAALLLFGVRTRRDLMVVALAQVVTNPLVELLCLTVGWRASLPLASAPWAIVAAAELAAWLVEALLYRAAGTHERPWLMSAALNGISFGTGLLLAAVGVWS